MLMFAFCRQSSIERIGRIAEHATQKQQAPVSTFFSDSNSSVHRRADVHAERFWQYPFDDPHESFGNGLGSSLDALFETFEIGPSSYLFNEPIQDEELWRGLQLSDLTISDQVQQQQPNQQPNQHLQQQQHQQEITTDVDGQIIHDYTHRCGDVFTAEAAEENFETQECIAEQDNTTPLPAPFFEIYTYVHLLISLKFLGLCVDSTSSHRTLESTKYCRADISPLRA